MVTLNLPRPQNAIEEREIELWKEEIIRTFDREKNVEIQCPRKCPKILVQISKLPKIFQLVFETKRKEDAYLTRIQFANLYCQNYQIHNETKVNAELVCNDCQMILCQNCQSEHCQIVDFETRKTTQCSNNSKTHQRDTLFTTETHQLNSSFCMIKDLENSINQEIKSEIKIRSAQVNLAQSYQNQLRQMNTDVKRQENNAYKQIDNFYESVIESLKESQKEAKQRIRLQVSIAEGIVLGKIHESDLIEKEAKQYRNQILQKIQQFALDTIPDSHSIIADKAELTYHLNTIKKSRKLNQNFEKNPNENEIQECIQQIKQSLEGMIKFPDKSQFLQQIKFQCLIKDPEIDFDRLINNLFEKKQINKNATEEVIEKSIRKRDAKYKDKVNKISANLPDCKNDNFLDDAILKTQIISQRKSLKSTPIDKKSVKSKAKQSRSDIGQFYKNKKQSRITKRTQQKKTKSQSKIVNSSDKDLLENEMSIRSPRQFNVISEQQYDLNQIRLIENKKSDLFNRQQEEEKEFQQMEASTLATFQQSFQNQQIISPLDKKRARHQMDSTESMFKTRSSIKRQKLEQDQKSLVQTPRNLSKNQVFATPTDLYLNFQSPIILRSQRKQEMIQPNQLQLQRQKLEQSENKRQSQNISESQASLQQNSFKNSKTISDKKNKAPIKTSVEEEEKQENINLNSLRKSGRLSGIQIVHDQRKFNPQQEIPRSQNIIAVVIADLNSILFVDLAKLGVEQCISLKEFDRTYTAENNQEMNKSRSFLTSNSASCMFPPQFPNKMLITQGSDTFVMEVDPIMKTANISKLNQKIRHARINHQIIFVNKSFYAIGGEMSPQKKYCEKIRLKENGELENQWIQCRMPSQSFHSQFGAVALSNNKIIVIGSCGKQFSQQNNSIEIFDPASEYWRLIITNQQKKFYQSIACVKVGTSERVDKIMIIGQLDEETRQWKEDLEIFEMLIKDDQIIRLDQIKDYKIPSRSLRGNVFFADNKVFIIGGQTDKQDLICIDLTRKRVRKQGSYKSETLNPLSGVCGGVFTTQSQN